jgi:cell division protease FtsH
MVKEYGMSKKVGQVYFARERQNRFLNLGPEGAAEYSEATAELIDNEVREIINAQYAKVIEILNKCRSVLDRGAKLLLSKEKIEGNEIKAIMQKEQIT